MVAPGMFFAILEYGAFGVRGPRMLKKVVRWLRTEVRKGHTPRRCARWIGRSWARVSYGYGVEPTWLELNRLEVPIPSLSSDFAGYRIAQLSDFHCSRQVTPAKPWPFRRRKVPMWLC
jgi:hypothetical protein